MPDSNLAKTERGYKPKSSKDNINMGTGDDN